MDFLTLPRKQHRRKLGDLKRRTNRRVVLRLQECNKVAKISTIQCSLDLGNQCLRAGTVIVDNNEGEGLVKSRRWTLSQARAHSR